MTGPSDYAVIEQDGQLLVNMESIPRDAITDMKRIMIFFDMIMCQDLFSFTIILTDELLPFLCKAKPDDIRLIEQKGMFQKGDLLFRSRG
jgi:hypothetical protein